MAKTIILNAGHTLTGSGSGAVGHIVESEETRKVVTYVKHHLRNNGYNVIIANCDRAKSQSAYLSEVVRKANQYPDAALFVSIHFNAGGGRGCECFTWKGRKIKQAAAICDELSKFGFRNRGVKDGSGFYVIKKTKIPAILVEVCFVDNKQDCEQYRKTGVNCIAQAITRGIIK
jgi:N-acetylmuramoyl-L-alanine amidase